jgi:hypothetical protein
MLQQQFFAFATMKTGGKSSLMAHVVVEGC